MDTSVFTDETMKARCTHCGFDFSEPAPILTVCEPVGTTHYKPHDLCPKCLYMDTIKREYVKRDVPLKWEDFMKEATEHSNQEMEAHYKIFGEVAVRTRRNPLKKTITYTFVDDKYGPKTIDMVVMHILVYLEHREIQRRFANLRGREELIKKYEKNIESIKEVRKAGNSNYTVSGKEIQDNIQEIFEEFIAELKKLL